MDHDACSRSGIRIAFIAVALAARSVWAAPLGDCSSEPGLAARQDVVFCEPWEKDDWYTHGFTSDGSKSNPHPATANDTTFTTVVSSPCVAGNCLKLTMAKGETRALAVHWAFRNAALAPEQAYLRYYFRIASGWNANECDATGAITDDGGKLVGFADVRTDADPSGQCGNGGDRSDGINCWSARGGYRGCNGNCDDPTGVMRIGTYTYFPGQEDFTGSMALWDDNPKSVSMGAGGSCATTPNNVACGIGKGGQLVPDRWYLIEAFVKMNTPGVADGVLRGWVDGVLSFEKTNMKYREVGHDGLHVRTVWLDIYKGGVVGNCVDADVFIDQMVLATDARVGAVGGAPSSGPPPTMGVDGGSGEPGTQGVDGGSGEPAKHAAHTSSGCAISGARPDRGAWFLLGAAIALAGVRGRRRWGMVAAALCWLSAGCGGGSGGAHVVTGSDGGAGSAGSTGSANSDATDAADAGGAAGGGGVPASAGGNGGGATTHGGGTLCAAPGWCDITGTHLQDVCPARGENQPAATQDYDFPSFCRHVTGAWSGGIADPERKRMIVWGGGHDDYYGNEIYALELDGLTMHRLNKPSPINGDKSTCAKALADGRPNARHSYGGLSYIQHAGRMFVFGGSMACGAGDAGGDTWTLNLATLEWTRMDPVNGGHPRDNLASVSDYDPATKRVYLFDRDTLWSYDYDSNTYAQVGDAPIGLDLSGAIDPKRHLFVLVGTQNDGSAALSVIDISAGGAHQLKNVAAQATGCADMFVRNPGVAYNPLHDKMVVWPGGDTVVLYDVDSNSCVKRTFAGGPGPAVETGTYGRWRYVPNLDVFALVNQAGGDAFTFRLPPP